MSGRKWEKERDGGGGGGGGLANPSSLKHMFIFVSRLHTTLLRLK